jgi:hypothetical protein
MVVQLFQQRHNGQSVLLLFIGFRVALIRVALIRVALIRVALIRVALIRVALIRVALIRVALIRVALIKLTPDGNKVIAEQCSAASNDTQRRCFHFLNQQQMNKEESGRRNGKKEREEGTGRRNGNNEREEGTM